MTKSRVVERRNVALAGYVVARSQEVAAGLPVPILERQVERLDESAEDVERQAKRLHILADRLLGMESAEGKASDTAPAPSHSVGKLNEAHERLAGARGWLDLAVNRLEAL